MPLKPTPEIIEFYDDIITFKPHWPDGCNHPPESYLCSFKTYKPGNTPDLYDMYLFTGRVGLELCLRCGKEVYEYLSPGGVEEFMLRNRNVDASFCSRDPYGVAVKILKEYGRLTYKLNQ